MRTGRSLSEEAVALNIAMLPAELYETILPLIPRMSVAGTFGSLQLSGHFYLAGWGVVSAVGGEMFGRFLQPAFRRFVFMDEHAAAVLGRLSESVFFRSRGRELSSRD